LVPKAEFKESIAGVVLIIPVVEPENVVCEPKCPTPISKSSSTVTCEYEDTVKNKSAIKNCMAFFIRTSIKM
jgi:hypothetical protein